MMSCVLDGIIISTQLPAVMDQTIHCFNAIYDIENFFLPKLDKVHATLTQLNERFLKYFTVLIF